MNIEHLAPYLPYGLKGVCNGVFYTLTNECGHTTNMDAPNESTSGITTFLKHCKPILRPLSDLTEDEYWKLSGLDPKMNFGFWYGKRNGTSDKREYIHYESYASRRFFLQGGVNQFTYKMMKFFFQHHFDIFGLIEKGEAINMNEI